MHTVDITLTPAACREIARVFAAQCAQSEVMIEQASRALDALDGLDDNEIGPWDHALLVAAFNALGDSERVRVAHMKEGLDALGPDTADDEDKEDHDNVAHA